MSEQFVDGFQRGSAAAIGPQIEAKLAAGEQVVLQVSGDSMRPTLKPRRDAVVLDVMDTWPPKRGDILFFRSERSPSGYALHRVVRVTPEGPIMNGDAQNWVEGPIARDMVLAKAVALMRAGKPLDVSKPGYRIYVSLWRFTRPIRHPMFALWRKIKGV